MTNENNYPHTVINEGVPGARSADGAATIANTVAKYPDVTLYLVLYGTNDSSIFMPVPSGKGLNPGDAGYPGTFKDNMQQIVDAINAAGKVAALAKVPITLADCSTCPFSPDPSVEQKNAFIRDFNMVIDELVADSGNNITIAPPDFYTYFEANYATEYSDYLHPNGMGYDSMAELWFEALAP